MSAVEDIESAIRQLSREELSALREWFAEFDAELWDRQIEEDLASGKLNGLIDQARNAIREGRCTDL